ncbi:MAG TPA: sugar ABC transporter permease [Candidatus Limnocylindria bacterium]|nr:sugar ABC transporter permease [Candidatus Limnocylindria bacterium]
MLRGGRARAVPYLFLLPALAVFALFYLWPAINTVLSSLFTWSILRPWTVADPSQWRFAGLDNYLSVLTDGRFWNAVRNTVIWLVIFPIVTTLFSLAIAILVWQLSAGARLFRTIFVLPMTVSLTAAGVLWALVYNPDFGVVSAALGGIGLDGANVDLGPLQLHLGDWLSNVGSLALGFTDIPLVNLTVIAPAFWALTGFGVISFTAGLTALNAELVEAARVEGANAWQVVRHIVVPSLRPAMIIVGVVFVIYALRTFDVVWVTTNGGPGTDTEVVAILLWREALAVFDTPSAGQATAIAVLLSAIMVVGAYPYLRSLLREAEA